MRNHCSQKPNIIHFLFLLQTTELAIGNDLQRDNLATADIEGVFPSCLNKGDQYKEGCMNNQKHTTCMNERSIVSSCTFSSSML